MTVVGVTLAIIFVFASFVTRKSTFHTIGLLAQNVDVLVQKVDLLDQKGELLLNPLLQNLYLGLEQYSFWCRRRIFWTRQSTS